MDSSFKYTSSFSSKIAPLSNPSGIDEIIASESLRPLRGIAPPDIDLEKNIDLIGLVFNAAVANRFNKNDDGIDTETALSIKDYFVHKPANIEHQKSRVVGHIVSAALSKYGTSELLDVAEAALSTDPFNISLCAVIYKTINPEFAELVQRSVDPDDEYYQKVSASWEIGFNSYKLALGSRILKEAEIISDEAHVGELKKYLKAYGGDGKTEDGVPIYRLISGEIFPLGIGFTSNPAAEVKGVEVLKDDGMDLNFKEKRKAKSTSFETAKNFTTQKNSQINSHFAKNDVNLSRETKNVKDMETQEIVQKLEEILSEHSEQKDFSEKAVANVAKLFHDTILEKNEIWKKESVEKETAIKSLQEAAIAKDSEIEDMKKQLSSTVEDLVKLQESDAKRIANENFNSRMSLLDDVYQLEDEDRAILASELKEVGVEDSEFVAYQAKLAVSWKAKTKAFIEEQEKLFEEKVAAEVSKRLTNIDSENPKPNPEEVVEAAMENIEGEGEVVLNNNGDASQEALTLREKFKRSFNKENVSIQY